jgi:glycosyltransferase involved in cell wall biosynthesis
LEKWLELQAHQHADIIVANTSTNKDILLKSFPSLKPSKVVVVPNGMDPNDFCGLPPLRPEAKSGCINIVFIGSLYGGMIDCFLAALKVLKQIDPSALTSARYTFIGYVNDADRTKVDEAGLAHLVIFQGMVSYRESLQYMLGADLLLYLLPGRPEMGHCIPSKLYNYLYARRPLLAIVPDGDAAKIIRDCNAGEIFNPTQTEEIAKYLSLFITEGCSAEKDLDVNMENIARFERRQQVHNLARAITAVQNEHRQHCL